MAETDDICTNEILKKPTKKLRQFYMQKAKFPAGISGNGKPLIEKWERLFGGG
jgi:hypothetical protein